MALNLQKTLVSAIMLAVASGSVALGATRSSPDYEIFADAIDFAGGASSTADLALTGSMGGFEGHSADADPSGVSLRHGYQGQLYTLVGFGLTSSNFYPPELGATQIFAVHTADDGTGNLIPAQSVVWSVVSGPLSAISAEGSVSAEAVYQDTEARVRGEWMGFSGELPLYVQDSIADNFGLYAGDLLPDAWQNLYFGLSNASAAPAFDADGDGYSNYFEYLAGLVPTDATSAFQVEVVEGPTPVEGAVITFGPLVSGRSYFLESKDNILDGVWQPVAPATYLDENGTRTIVDSSAHGAFRVYHVRITMP